MGTAQSSRVNQYHRNQAIWRKSWNSQAASSGIALKLVIMPSLWPIYLRSVQRRQYYEETASYQDHSRINKCREREGLERSES
ncbi:2'-acyl-2-O-sulfo-trehalose (hydroxy)phthioceranyltransferase PapA1 [Trichinella spiralis]|uniref:2'-acyl-2-O-sulfo-trehalose (Hydroxy)phthioceranyltransferase PapA1 n=1 Tax=Trichinella spiralis TaxID=6334 RepID=A0ABR3KR40_TRISP